MKTKQANQPTPSGNPQADADTNPKEMCPQMELRTYEVSFILSTDFSGTITATGRTPDEARENAEDIILEMDCAELENVGSEIFYQGIRPVKGGEVHE